MKKIKFFLKNNILNSSSSSDCQIVEIGKKALFLKGKPNCFFCLKKVKYCQEYLFKKRECLKCL